MLIFRLFPELPRSQASWWHSGSGRRRSPRRGRSRVAQPRPAGAGSAEPGPGHHACDEAGTSQPAHGKDLLSISSKNEPKSPLKTYDHFMNHIGSLGS